MKKDIFKALIISTLILSLIFTLLACAGEDNFTPSGTLPNTPVQDQEKGENNPDKPSTPGTTDKPTDPATPDVPVTPSDPADPGDPIVPVTPSDPEKPSASAIPDTPAEPSAAVEQKPDQKTLDILASTTKRDFENIIKGGLASTLVSLADGSVWGIDDDNDVGFTLRSSKPAIKLSVSPGAAIVFCGNDTYKGLSNVVDAYSEQRAMGGWILQNNGDLWVWNRDGVTVYDPVKIAENIAQYFQDQKVAITTDGDLVHIDYQVQAGQLVSSEITKLMDNVKTYSQGLAIDSNNMVWRINGGKATKMLSHGKTVANENYVITEHNELWYIPYSGYPRMISENTAEYYGGEYSVILTSKGTLTYTAEEKTQLIAEDVARVFSPSIFIDKTGSLYRYDFESKEKTLIDINVVHYESGYYIKSDATLWEICYENGKLSNTTQVLDNVLMPDTSAPYQPSAETLKLLASTTPKDFERIIQAGFDYVLLVARADGTVWGGYVDENNDIRQMSSMPALKFIARQYGLNTLNVDGTFKRADGYVFTDVVDADADVWDGWVIKSDGSLWTWYKISNGQFIGIQTEPEKIAKNVKVYYPDQDWYLTPDNDLMMITSKISEEGIPVAKLLLKNVKTCSGILILDNNNMLWVRTADGVKQAMANVKSLHHGEYIITEDNILYYVRSSEDIVKVRENIRDIVSFGADGYCQITTNNEIYYGNKKLADDCRYVIYAPGAYQIKYMDNKGNAWFLDEKTGEKHLAVTDAVYACGIEAVTYCIKADATLWISWYENGELCSKQILDNVLMPGQTPEQPAQSENPATPVSPATPSDIGFFATTTDIQ